MQYFDILLCMKAVVQRVKYANVEIEGKIHGSVDNGYLVLLGVTDTDTEEIAKKLAEKIVKMRVFEDDAGKMNLSIEDVGGKILSISQFTLYADTHKGNRPSFTKAGKPDIAKHLYEVFNAHIQSLGIDVETGIFGADMKVSLLNDGPVTIILDTDE